MSDESQKILQKLGDELGHITLIADWVERTKAQLANGTLEVGGVLTGHGAGAPPLADPEVPPAPPAPAADPAPTDKPSAEVGNGQADLSGAQESPAADNGEQPASAAPAGEAPADGDTAPLATSAPSEEATAAAPEDVKPAE